ncbi:hypothetical protein ACQEVM_20530 [Streptomyces sp. CA-243310]|uniref:hypothetical protein n=1 Tax=Streptomyces sp. CA-243310 TaxID=3240056 RepID=UPI003D8BA232
MAPARDRAREDRCGRRREGRRRTSARALDVRLLGAVLTGAAVPRYRGDAGVWPPVPVPLLSAGAPAIASAVSRRRPGAAVFLANAFCALGLFDPGTPANAYLLAPAGAVRDAGLSGPTYPVEAALVARDTGRVRRPADQAHVPPLPGRGG